MRRNKADTMLYAVAAGLAVAGYFWYRALKARSAAEAERLRGAPSGLGTGGYDPSQWGGR